MTTLQQITHIQDYLSRIYHPGDLIEIRGLKSDEGTLRILTRDLFLAAKTAVAMESRNADVYYCLNPIDPESKYATSQTHDYPARRCPTARDQDIACRNLYLIDVDPVRKAGTASTTTQRLAAEETAQAILMDLCDRGWSMPTVIDSGNGVHLIYHANRCAADGSDLHHALKALNAKFGGVCTIDSTVSNPARIARLPGCLNRKAGRRANLMMQCMDPVEVLPHLVLKLAKEDPAYRPPSWAATATTRRMAAQALVIDDDGVQDLIDEYPTILDCDGVSQREEATYYSLASCPFKGAPHSGQAVGMGKTTIVLRDDSIGFKCFSAGCHDHTFADLLRLLYRKTGRWPQTQIWDMDDSALDAKWGGVDDLTQRPTQ